MGRENKVKFMFAKRSTKNRTICVIKSQIARQALNAMEDFLREESTKTREQLLSKKFRKSEFN